MKRLIVLLIAFALLMPSSLLEAAKNDSINVFIDGKKVSFEVDPVVVDGTTLVQYTTIFKLLGMQSSWDQSTKTITGVNDYVLMKLTIGSRKALVNNHVIKLSAAPLIVEGRTMVPLRFVSEVTGANVVWDKDNDKIKITSPPARNDLSKIMREHRWNDSVNSVEKRETATIKSNTAGTTNKQRLLRYEAIDWLGFSVNPTFSFTNDKLTNVYYQLNLNAKDNQTALTTVGEIYGKLSKYFGEPYRDEVYFTSADQYSEDMTVIGKRIAAGKAKITITWQAGYTSIELSANGNSSGNIALQVAIYNTK